MKYLLTTALLAFFIAMTAHAETGQYRHVVLFKFKDSATKEQVKQIEDAFRALPSKVGTVLGYEWGTNISPEKRNEGFTHCFLLTFADKGACEAYLIHPAHKEFGALLHPILDKVLVVDFVSTK